MTVHKIRLHMRLALCPHPRHRGNVALRVDSVLQRRQGASKTRTHDALSLFISIFSVVKGLANWTKLQTLVSRHGRTSVVKNVDRCNLPETLMML